MRTSHLIGLGCLTISLLLLQHLRKKNSSRPIQFICHPTAIFVLEIKK